MQRTQNKKNEILLCTHKKCEKPQTADSGEYCDKHYPKLKRDTYNFTPTEFEILFDALDVYATEIHDAQYNGMVDTYGTKREVQTKLKAIKKLELKLNTI